jgi:hypothetical protein
MPPRHPLASRAEHHAVVRAHHHHLVRRLERATSLGDRLGLALLCIDAGLQVERSELALRAAVAS